MPDGLKPADHIGQGENGEHHEADYQKGMREKLH